jgi:hypothetical protein
LYEDLKDEGFVVITVAMESRGADAARPYIERARPTHPCLIDAEHIVSELYNMVNVPSAVWIAEDGRIVRPTETAGTGDEWRGMMKGGMSPDESSKLRQRRKEYTDAVRDWVAKGDESAYALSSAQMRERMKLPTDNDALAAAHFRIGRFLWERGDDEAYAFLEEAKRLRPDSWNFKRQTWNLQAPGDERSGGPEFWAAVEALGEHWYYEPVTLP